MREIKFRGFSKKENWMYDVFSFCKDYVKVIVGEGMVNKYPIEDFEPLMQFTGLFDKNGVEIFEGDVLNFGVKGKNTTVTFDNGAFNAFNEPLGWDFDYPNYPAKDDLKYCEVIGNIHSNPELLNQ